MIESATILISEQELQKRRKKVFDTQGDYAGDPAIYSVVRTIRENKRLLAEIINNRLSRSGTHNTPDVLSYDFVQLNADQWRALNSGETEAQVMQCRTVEKIIVINDDAVKQDLLYDARYAFIYTLHAVIHELGHAALFDEHLFIETPRGTYVSSRGGVQHNIIPIKESGDTAPDHRETITLFELLNEIINDEFAEEVTREFVGATGVCAQADIESFYSVWLEKHFYSKARKLLDGISRAMARKMDVQESTVRDSFRRAAIMGENLVALQGQFAELFGEDFIIDLAGIYDTGSLDAFMAKYHLN